MKHALLVTLVGLTGLSVAQTPPIKPQTPDVKVPPPVVLPPPPGQEQALGSQPLSPSEAVAIALRRNAQIRAARAGVEAAAGRTDQARSGLRPQLGASASLTEQESIRGGSAAGSGGLNRVSTGVSVDQLLFDFGRTRAQVRQQSALEEATRFALTATEHELALQVRLSFTAYAEALRLVEVSEANVGNRQRQLALAEARLDAGLGAPADFVRAKTQLADAVLALESARSAATNARVQLAERLGVDPRTPITPAATLIEEPPGTPDLTALVDTAIRQRPEIQEAQRRVVAAGLGVAVARLTNAPRISATAGINARGSDSPFDSQTGSIGLMLSWSFGDGGLTAGRTREARANEDTARANLETLSQRVVTEVSQALVDLLTAAQRLETAQVQLANARELLRISEGRYEGGIGQFIEVTDAQSLLFSAERNVVVATNDLQRAQARLRRAVGDRPNP